ncbi:MAG: PEGA domain-containing protein, partial [Bdellovibrionales bacterium]|nr:PEGA domain-containing protein [Bdellovibrionales bacterium]
MLIRLLSFSVLFLTGCASLTHNGRNQVVVVDSRPSGAEVVYQGKVVGLTPALVEVERGKKVEVEVRHQEAGSKTLRLKADYRWGRSFAGNLVWLSLAPVGWFVDLIKGSC